MRVIFPQLLMLYVFIFLGYFLGKCKKDLNTHSSILSFLAVNIFLPAKVFNSFSTYFTTSYIAQNYKLLLISLCLLTVLHFLGKLVAKLVRCGEQEKGVFEYSIPISNYAYIGYVLVENVFGSMALTNMILFCLPFSFYTYTVGYMAVTGGKITFKRLLNPMTIAAVLGMAIGLSGLQVPDVVSKVFSSASVCAGPVAMILTGLVLSEFSIGRMLGDGKAYLLTGVRLAVIPLLVYASFTLLHLQEYMAPALIMAAMPCGLNTIIFPKNVGRSPELGAKLALISHVLSCITLPIWLSLL